MEKEMPTINGWMAVEVDGVEYRSTTQAMEQLRLPLHQSTLLRKLLKENGEGVYKYNGKDYHFRIAQNQGQNQ